MYCVPGAWSCAVVVASLYPRPRSMPCAMPPSRRTAARSSGAGLAAVVDRGACCACNPADARSAVAANFSTRVRMDALRAHQDIKQGSRAKAQGPTLERGGWHRMFSPEDSMKARSIGGFAAAAAIVAASLVPAVAQRGGGAAQPPDNAPTPRMADGPPGLTGWRGGRGGGVWGGRDAARLLYSLGG